MLQIIDTEWISMSLYEVMVDYFSPTTIQPSLDYVEQLDHYSTFVRKNIFI